MPQQNYRPRRNRRERDPINYNQPPQVSCCKITWDGVIAPSIAFCQFTGTPVNLSKDSFSFQAPASADTVELMPGNIVKITSTDNMTIDSGVVWLPGPLDDFGPNVTMLPANLLLTSP